VETPPRRPAGIGKLCNKLPGRSNKSGRYASLGSESAMVPDSAMPSSPVGHTGTASEISLSKVPRASAAPKIEPLIPVPPQPTEPVPLLEGPPVPTVKAEQLEARLMAAARHVEKLAASMEAQLATLADQVPPVPTLKRPEPPEPGGFPCLMVVRDDPSSADGVEADAPAPALSLADAPKNVSLISSRNDGDEMSNVGLQRHEQIRATRINTEARARMAVHKASRQVD